MSWCTIESDPDPARSSQRVRVAVIIRPLITAELGCKDCISVVHGEPQVQVGSRNFTFDYVYGGSTGSPSSTLYDDCVSPLVDALFHGRNATVLAYGQAGSGKTYTMGTNYSGEGSNVGVIPKVMEDIFQRVEVMKDSKEFVIRVSFIEIFKEAVYDLLVPNLRKGAAPLKRARDSIQIRDTGGGGTTLVGVTEAVVRTKEEMAKYLSRGSHSRATESTDMNRQSSRSHAIFTITMEEKKVAHFVARVTNEDVGDDNLCAKLLLVDLAGSECANQTGADGQRLKEGKHINKGLLALGKVIKALGEEKSDHIPYRDSKLTHLLQDSLGGNSKMVMIACVSPADSKRKETLSTLTYANDARNIQNKAVVLQRKIEKASMSTKSCLECREKDKEIREKDKEIREKDKEIRDLKENVFTLEMEKAELMDSLNASKKMRMATDGDLNNEGHKNDFCNQGYRSSSRTEDMDTSESEYLDDSDDDDWVLESEEKEKPVKKRICRRSVASNPLDTDCCSCSKNSYCKTRICPCRASGVSCRSLCTCLTRKCANGKTDSKDLGGTGVPNS